MAACPQDDATSPLLHAAPRVACAAWPLAWARLPYPATAPQASRHIPGRGSRVLGQCQPCQGDRRRQRAWKGQAALRRGVVGAAGGPGVRNNCQSWVPRVLPGRGIPKPDHQQPGEPGAINRIVQEEPAGFRPRVYLRDRRRVIREMFPARPYTTRPQSWRQQRGALQPVHT